MVTRTLLSSVYSEIPPALCSDKYSNNCLFPFKVFIVPYNVLDAPIPSPAQPTQRRNSAFPIADEIRLLRDGIAEFSHRDGITAFKWQGNLFPVLLLMAQYLMSQYGRERVLRPLTLLRACIGLAFWNPLPGSPGNRRAFPLQRFSGVSRAAVRDRLSGGLSFSFSCTRKGSAPQNCSYAASLGDRGAQGRGIPLCFSGSCWIPKSYENPILRVAEEICSVTNQ